jgi:hypothetical protein
VSFGLRLGICKRDGVVCFPLSKMTLARMRVGVEQRWGDESGEVFGGVGAVVSADSTMPLACRSPEITRTVE